MALHFIFGRAGTGKTARCCEEIRSYVAASSEHTALFLVPDQTTYRTESMLAAAFPGRGFANVSVYGLSRLAYRVFQELHVDANEVLSPLMQQLILKRILTERKKELRVLSLAARQPHFARSMASFLHQLSTFGVSDADLEKAAAAEGDTPLGRKLADLTLLSRTYHDYLSSHFRYQGNQYEKLAECIPHSAMLRRMHIWIDGWSGMIPQEIAVVRALIRTAAEVTVTLPMDEPSLAAEEPLFSRPYSMWAALKKDFAVAGSTALTEPVRFTCPRVRELAEHFFSPRPVPCRYPRATRVFPEQGVFLIEAADRTAEAEAAARRILSLVREKGFRYRDILVLLRHADTYADALRRSFSALGVPVFIDQRRPMDHHPLLLLVRSLLRFLAASSRGAWRGWRKDILFPLLKSDLFSSFASDDTDRLENYVLRIGIRPYQWKEAWKFHDPFELDSDNDMPSGPELDELNRMNEYRRALLDRLIPLEDRWKAARTVREKCAFLYDFLLEEKVPETLARRDERTFAETKERPNREVWKKFLSLLDDLVRAAGDDEMPSDEFLSAVTDGASSLTFSLIPPTLDHVTVTDIGRGCSMEARAVFLLGANEGEFPAGVEEDGFFSETEKEMLKNSSGLITGPDLMSLIDQEAFYTYLALTRARDALYLSYAASENDGSALERSSLLSRIETLGYYTDERTIPLPTPATKNTEFLAAPEASLALLPAVLREGDPAPDSVWYPLRDWALSHRKQELLLHLRGLSYTNLASPLSPANAQKLFKLHKEISVTQFESYRSCPFRYFLEKGLKLRDREEGALQKNDFGNYLHAGLHSFGEILRKQKKNWRDATDEDIETLSAKIAAKVAPRVKSGALVSDAAAQYTERSLDRTFRETLRRFREWSRASRADMLALEEQFRFTIANEARTIRLMCRIDRLDKAGENAAVIDYKTGTPSISLQEIVTGYRLQLITYLMAVWEDEGLLPGALLYIYINGGSCPLSGGKKQPELAGYFLNDPDFLSALDTNFGTDDVRIPVKYKKDGTPGSSSKAVSPEELNALFAVTRENLLRLYEGIRGGRVPIRPVRYDKKFTPCTWCRYKSICRFDPRLSGCRYDDIQKKTDAEVRELLAERIEGKEETV